jgi:uncharacterized protein YdeI (YjbR/CyaY-like superfamily)
MATPYINPAVDFYFTQAIKWDEELKQLRKITLDCRLAETLKWGCPCYTFENANIVLIHVFKEYCALLFFKGALLQNTKSMLIQQTERVQAARQIRFTNVKEIVKNKAILKAYIHQAIEVEKAGLKVPFKKTEAFTMPIEFKIKLEKQLALKKAFEALTPGRQRGYLLHFAAPKQMATRQARVEKCMPKILKGKGLNDV